MHVGWCLEPAPHPRINTGLPTKFGGILRGLFDAAPAAMSHFPTPASLRTPWTWLYICPVFYDLQRTRREGKLIARHEMGQDPFVRGILLVQERQVVDLSRHSIVASFSAQGVHDLYDVTIRHTDSCGYLVLTGFEHRTDLPGRPVDFAQSWILRISKDQSQPASLEAIMARAKETAGV